MVDYICRLNKIPLCSDYNDIRRGKLDELVYPAGVLLLSKVLENDKTKEDSMKNAIPEFLQYNIEESEIRDVV